MQIFTLDVYFVGRGLPTRLVAIAESFDSARAEILENVIFKRSIQNIVIASSTFVNNQTTLYRLDSRNEDKFKFDIVPFSNYELD